MIYTEQLPRVITLQELADKIKNFPISGLGVVQCAEHLGYDEKTINFIKLFSRRLIFNSRTDFLNHCRLLEGMLREERHSMPEHPQNPQD